MSFWLEYIDGDGLRHTIQYDGTGELWVGRRLGCSIHSFDERLSREHCWVEFDAESGHCVLQDNASTDGTFVNGAPVVSHPLSHGDVIECASLLITFWALPRGAIDTRELDDARARAEQATIAVARLQAERDAARASLDELESSLRAERDAAHRARMDSESEFRSELESARDARRHRDEEIEKYRVREAKLNAQLDWLENRVRDLEQRPASDNGELLTRLRDELAAHEERAHKAEAEARELRETLDETRELLAKVRKQLDQTTQALGRQRAEADEAAHKRDEMWVELKDVRQTAEELRQVVDNQEKLIATLRDVAREREAMIDKLRHG